MFIFLAHAMSDFSFEGYYNLFSDNTALHGQVTLLKRYESERKSSNIAMMAILDGFQKAYSVRLWAYKCVASCRISWSQLHLTPEEEFISFASGEQRFPLFL